MSFVRIPNSKLWSMNWLKNATRERLLPRNKRNTPTTFLSARLSHCSNPKPGNALQIPRVNDGRCRDPLAGLGACELPIRTTSASHAGNVFSKGPNLTGLLDGKIVPLFHPRRQVWKRHFRWQGGFLVGKTLAGKVTVGVLNINEPARVIVRQSLCDEGRFPPAK